MHTTTRLPDDLTASSHARGLLRSTLEEWGATAVLDDAEIVVSELVANAVRHGSPPVTLSLDYRSDRLRIEVRDGATERIPLRREAESTDTGGRGLALVGALSRDWGCSRENWGKSVWAELALP